MPILTDPMFYLVAIPAVLLYAVAKGGFGGPISLISVPMMALVISPAQAAGILLPILLVMDGFALKTYWGVYDKRALHLLLPGALLGVVVGYITVDVMNEHWMRILIGAISLIFGLQSLFGFSAGVGRDHNAVSGSVLGSFAGFASFNIHAGGPLFSMYLMPKRLDPLLFAGTACIFFTVVNAVKLVPYYFLDLLKVENLATSLVLMPLAPVGVAIGHALVKRSKPEYYYGIISFFLALLGCKLLWDGYQGL